MNILALIRARGGTNVSQNMQHMDPFLGTRKAEMMESEGGKTN
jgi:hypothetical protein